MIWVDHIHSLSTYIMKALKSKPTIAMSHFHKASPPCLPTVSETMTTDFLLPTSPSLSSSLMVCSLQLYTCTVASSQKLMTFFPTSEVSLESLSLVSLLF